MTQIKPLLLLIAAVAFAVSPFLTPEFGGFDPSLYPIPQDDPPVQPAGYAFSIWSVIYLWLIASAAYGMWKRRDDAAWDAHRLPLIVSLAVGVFWLPMALVSPIGATVMIWVMLITALVALVTAPRGDHWWAAAPIGLYAGWLTAASCVSVGLLLAGWGWTGPLVAAWAGVLLALIVSLAMIYTRAVATFGIGVAWALVGVAVQNRDGALGLALAALGLAIVVVALTFLRLRQK
ncbi:tryptophan-rich sensory protein [Oceaniglobus trochenteri]|uniref:tryptophan-rich sensory protein n=1 Tax=Oceaniglobus trochenteri TaxID=2763260 RepID=UPI001CFFD67B|nr:tryptophan-rich sensory protein [Oceaniglobus trochenteri]